MKLVLRIEGGKRDGATHALAGDALEIGREDGCQCRFDADEKQVSRRHARIEQTSAGYEITDLDSTNGTWLNGARVRRMALRDGDLIELGLDGPRMRIEIDAEEQPAAAPLRTARRDGTIVGTMRYDPALDKGRRYSLRGLIAVFGMLGLGGFLGLLVVLMVYYKLGPMAAIMGATPAFAAAPLYLMIWLWLDRYDPEPAWILASVLIFGAGAATFVSSIVNDLFSKTMHVMTGSPQMAHFLVGSISAPFIEEAAKGVAVVIVFLFLRGEFDGVIDGIVYAGIVALGFATVENVLYYGQSVHKQGLAGLIAVFVLRGILGPFTHAVFTSMTGIGCGLARQSHNRAVRVVAPLLGYGAAVTLHFLWNAMAGVLGLAGFLVLYAVLWAPLFIVFFTVVISMGFREARMIRRVLQLEAARGLLTQDQIETVTSWPRRVKWMTGAMGSLKRMSARRDFVHAATRLALCFDHAARAARAGGETMSGARIPRLRAEIERLRSEI